MINTFRRPPSTSSLLKNGSFKTWWRIGPVAAPLICSPSSPTPKFKFIFKEFELLTAANEFYWIDTSSNNPENAHLAICGKLLSLDFSLPCTEFFPDIVPFLFRVSGERMDLSAYLPDINTSHDILFSLHKQVQDLSFISLFSDTSNCEAKAERPYSLLSFSSEVDTDIEDTSPQVEKYKYKFALLRGEAQLCLPYVCL